MGRNLMSRSAGMMGIGSRESSPNGGTLEVGEFFGERERECVCVFAAHEAEKHCSSVFTQVSFDV